MRVAGRCPEMHYVRWLSLATFRYVAEPLGNEGF
jgi:hypothetical protein